MPLVRKRFVYIFASLVVLTLLLIILIQYQTKKDLPNYIIYGNGRVEGRETQIATKFTGSVEEVFAEEGEEVKENQVLTRMDTRSMRAKLESMKSQANQILKEIETVDAEIELINSDIKLHSKDIKRIEKLIKDDFASEAQYDKKLNMLEKSKASLIGAKAKKEALENSHKSILSDIESLQINIDDMTIYAPSDGLITYRLAELGEVLQPGEPVFVMINPDELYMTLYANQLKSGKVRIRDKGIIKVDAFPDKVFDAYVSFISSEAEFTPKEVETRTERQKLVFRLKLNVEDNSERLLKIGMPGMGYIKIDDDKPWPKEIVE
ncbi:HlyD family secretion protein [Pseudomonadota bacterium]